MNARALKLTALHITPLIAPLAAAYFVATTGAVELPEGSVALLAPFAVILVIFAAIRLQRGATALAAVALGAISWSLFDPSLAGTVAPQAWVLADPWVASVVALWIAGLPATRERTLLSVLGAGRVAIAGAVLTVPLWLPLVGASPAELWATLPAALASRPTQTVAAVGVALIIGAQAWRQPRVALLGFAGAAASVLLVPTAGAQDQRLYLLAGALTLGISLLETSYSMAYLDELTRLPGRRALNETLDKLGGRYTVAMVDVDHFKKFNDTHGHDVGDQVLQLVARRLAAVGGGGRAYRYGGEEFTVVFPSKSRDKCLPHLEALRESIEKSVLTLRAPSRPKKRAQGRKQRGKGGKGGKGVSVTVSIGVAERSKRLRTPETVIKAADKALYKAKRGGRNQVA